MADGSDLTLWIAFSAGVLSFLSPCVLPLIPSYITYISGLTFSELKAAHPAWRVRLAVIAHSLVFVAGFSTIFISLGALAGLASSSFQEYLQEGLAWIQKIGGILIFLFGVHLSGLFHFGILLGERRMHLQRKPAGLIGTFLVGMAFAAGWTPCIGPILGTILALAASSTEGAERGVTLLTAYSAGLGIPFFVSGVLFHWFLSFFNRFRAYIRLFEILTGVLLMLVGILLFFDLFGWLAGYLYRWVPVTG